jgi:hypothetical protein
VVEYNIIIFTGNIEVGNKGFITYHKVSSIPKFIEFAAKTYPDWKFANVYDKKTRAKVDTIKP